jgi:hypothetical protein
MPSEVLVKNGTPVVWADTTDYSSTNSGYTRTHQIDLTSLANGAARQGAKADLGATRAARYAVRVGLEADVAPTAGTFFRLYWSASASATAGTGNDGGASGADAAYKASEEAEWVRQLIHLGDIPATNDAAPTVQMMTINGDFKPPERYGMPVAFNQWGQALEGDAVEMFIALIPLVDEIQ